MSDASCLADWCEEDDWCAITCTADVLEKKWHPVLIHRLLVNGPLGFNALKDASGSISSNVLSSSLEDLEEKDIVTRMIVNEKPFRVEYSLTDRGLDLAPIIDAMEDWGRKHARSQPA